MRNLMGGKGSIGFLRNKHKVYIELIDLLLEQWRQENSERKKQSLAAEALKYLEMSRLGALRRLFEQALPAQKESDIEKLNEANYKLSVSSAAADAGRLSRKKNKSEKLLGKKDLLLKRNQINSKKFKDVIKKMDSRQIMLEFYYDQDFIYVWKFEKKKKMPYLLPPIKRGYTDELEGTSGKIIEEDIIGLYKVISDKEKLFDKKKLIADDIITSSEYYDKTTWQYVGHNIDVVYDKLFLPLAVNAGEYDHISIIPYGELGVLPFSLLGDEKYRLVDKFTINYYFSAIQQLLPESKIRRKSLLAVGNPEFPDFGPESSRAKSSKTRGTKIGKLKVTDAYRFKEAEDIFSRISRDHKDRVKGDESIGFDIRGLQFEELRDAGHEVRQIKRNFAEIREKDPRIVPKMTVKYDQEVSEKLIKTEITKNYNYLHFATHGLLVHSNPLDSFIVFSEGDPNVSQYDSGLFTVKEIRKELFGKLDHVRLAVLSACQTSLAFSGAGSPIVTGLEYATLSGAFQSAGVNTVIASLWEVSSEATALLMEKFYHYLITEDQPIAKALQLAQQDFRNEECTLNIVYKVKGKEKQAETDCNKEYFWAPFIVLGSPD